MKIKLTNYVVDIYINNIIIRMGIYNTGLHGWHRSNNKGYNFYKLLENTGTVISSLKDLHIRTNK